MTPPINLFPAINCIDDRGMFFLQIGANRWYLRPPKSDTAADGVIGTTMKSCIHRHIWIRGPWGRQNYFKPKRRYFFLVLATSGASNQDASGAYGCNFSWQFHRLHLRRPCPTSAAWDITNLSLSTFTYLWQLPTFMASFFLVTGNEFIAIVIVTDDNCSPGSLSPVINLSPVWLSPAIIFDQCRWHRWEIYCPYQQHWRSLKIRGKDYLPVSTINLSPVSLTPVNSLSPVSLTLVINIHSRMSPRIFKKNQNGPMEYLGARGAMIHEKNLKSKISCQTPFNNCPCKKDDYNLYRVFNVL